MTRRLVVGLLAVVLAAAAEEARFPDVPGTVLAHSPAESRIYLGDPGLTILADGTLLARYNTFGPGLKDRPDLTGTRICRSDDRGATWRQTAHIPALHFTSAFEHEGAFYLIGSLPEGLVILKSVDRGATWTEPRDAESGLILADTDGKSRYHSSSCPVVLHRGRLWRAVEDRRGPGGWGRHFRSFILSAPEDADLLRAESWQSSEILQSDVAWLDGTFRGWLEGNPVVSPEGDLRILLRAEVEQRGATAAVIRVSDDGKSLAFDPQTGFIDFPGGNKKFTIHRDPQTGLYYTLSNWIPPRYLGLAGPGALRNTLALVRSRDLVDWEVRTVLLHHPEHVRHGFQYVEWQFDGDDIAAVSRTGYDDGLGGAHNAHDANFITFHRFPNFRALTPADSVTDMTALLERPVARLERGGIAAEGYDIDLGVLQDGATAYGNRTYVWEGVPAELSGRAYTRTKGGVDGMITVRAERDAILLLAVAKEPGAPGMPDWEPVPEAVFRYTDANRTRLYVYRVPIAGGRPFTLPRLAWSGTLVVFPE